MSQDPEVRAYLEALPQGAQRAMDAVMTRTREALPGADEVMRYGIPTFRLAGRSVVHVGAWKEHLSLYPVPAGDPDLAEAVAPYVAGRGTLRFPLAEPMPLPLIGRVVEQLRDTQVAP